MVDYRTENLLRAKAAEEDALAAQADTEFKRDNFLLDQLLSSHHAYVGGKLIKSCIVNNQVEGQLLTNLFKNPSLETPDGTTTLYQNLFTNPRFKTSGGTQEAYRNLFQNPNFETSSDDFEICRNLFTNPSFQTTDGTVEVRRNLFRDPGMRVQASGAAWAGSSGASGAYSLESAAWSRSGSAVRYTVSGGPGAESIGANVAIAALTAGQVYTAVYKIVSSVAKSNVPAVFKGSNSAEWPISASSPNQDMSPGVPALFWMTFTAGSAGTPRFSISKSFDDGEYTEISEVDVYPGEYQPERDWHSGDYSYDSDLTPSWTGSANASESILSGEKVKSGTSNRVITIRSSQWSLGGGSSARLISTSQSSADAYHEPILSSTGTSGGVGAVLKPNTTYTVMGTVRYVAPLGQVLNNGKASIFVHLNSGEVVRQGAAAPNGPGVANLDVPGTYRCRVVFTTPASLAGYNTIRLYGGGLVGGGDVWWDEVLLVEGIYSGGYFDGDAPEKVLRNLIHEPIPQPGSSRYPSGSDVFEVGGVKLAGKQSAVPSRYEASSYRMHLTVGQTYTVSFVAVGDKTVPNVSWSLRLAESIGLSPHVVSNSIDITQVPKRFSLTFTATQSVMYVGIKNSSSVDPEIPTTWGIGEVLLTRAGDPHTWFDPQAANSAWEGDENASPSYQYDSDTVAHWEGTAHDSESYVTGANARYASINRATGSTAWVAKTDDGVKFVRPSSDTEGSYRLALFQTPGIASAGINAGEKLTVLVDMTSPAAFNAQTRFASASGLGPFDQVNVNIEAGRKWYKVVFTANASVTQTTIGFYYSLQNSALLGAGPTVFHKILVIEGDYGGDYFDGSLSPDADLVAAWTGAPEDSESILSGSYPKRVTPTQNDHRAIISASGGMRAFSLNAKTQQYDFVSLTDLGFLPGDDYTLIADLTLEGPAEYAQGVIGAYVRYWGAASPSLSAITPLVEGRRVRVEIRETIPLDTTGSAVFRIQGTQGTSVRVENLLIAPGKYARGYFDGDAPSKIRRNLAVDQDISRSSTWTTDVGLTRVMLPGGGAQVDVPAATSGSRRIYGTVDAIVESVPVRLGERYSASMLVSVPSGYPAIVAQLALRTYRDIENTEYRGPEVTINPGETKVVFRDGAEILEGYDRSQLLVYVGQVGVNPNILPLRYVVNKATIERSELSSEPFSGSSGEDYEWEGLANYTASYKYDRDFTAEWDGVAHDSKSKITAPRAKDATVTQNGTGLVLQSTRGMAKRGKSVRIIPTSSSNNTWVAPGGDSGAMRLGMQAGKTYTALATCYFEEASIGTPSITLMRESWVIVGRSLVESTAPGRYDVRLTFTVPQDATQAFIRLYNGNTIDGCEVWWSNFVLVEGEYTGDYFDGDITSLPVERENMALRPTGASEVNAGLEGGGSGSSAIVETPSMLLSSKVYEFTHISGSRGISITSAAGVGGGQLATGETFTISFSVWVKEGGASPDFVIRNQNWQNSGLVVTASSGASMWNHAVSKRGEWVRVYFTFNSTSATSIKCYSATNDSADYYIDGILIQRGGLEEYFDGDSPNSYWTGEPNDSPSARYPARYNTPRWLGAEHDSKSQMWARAYDVPQPSSMLVHNNPDGTIYLSGPGVHDDGEGTISISDDNVTVHPGGVLEF